MPDLPTLNLSQAHFDRVVVTFPGADLAAKAVAYRAWLTNRLIDRVEVAELTRVDAEFTAARTAALAAVKNSLPPRAVEA